MYIYIYICIWHRGYGLDELLSTYTLRVKRTVRGWDRGYGLEVRGYILRGMD
jgi:hypothetical protein